MRFLMTKFHTTIYYITLSHNILFTPSIPSLGYNKFQHSVPEDAYLAKWQSTKYLLHKVDN